MEYRDARYAPPQARVEDLGSEQPGEGEPAARLTRLWAAMVDRFIALGVAFIVRMLTSWDVWGLHGPIGVREMLLRSALFLVLQGYLLATRGQTIGKAIFRLRIARPDGSVPSFARLAGLRYGVLQLVTVVLITVFSPTLGLFLYLADALFIFRKSRRCLHDLIADTVVLRA